ncbi:hypothetical protein HYY73_03500, partial [Candidatus Woesearchaeota archaeon]|nr:hypothetical protein [Candidatus Woesearchaeota archaeon]
LLKVVIGNANVNDTQDFVNNQSYNRYMIAVSKYLHNGDNNGWAPNEVSLYNTSNLTSGGGSSANESQGDTAIEAGINSSIPTATKYKEQQVYVRNLSNNQTLGTFDWVAAFGSQRWVLNYITAGESYVRAPNLTTAVYVLEIADKTTLQITDEVSKLINATKS